MSIKIVKILVILLFIAVKSFSQQEIIKGKVTNKLHSPIEYATIILQSEDKSHQSVTHTDSIGDFTFDKTYDRNYILIIHHVAYVTDTLRIGPKTKVPTTLALLEKSNVLKELIVTSERPLMKVEDNKYIYYIEPLLKNKIVLNAYEAVKEIPGIIELGGSLSLAGSESLKIVIDGQATSLSAKQILEILKSTSSSKIEKIEVSYNAPARYNTNGALINIALKADENKSQPFTGELGGTYLQSYYPSARQNIGLSYNKDKLRIDFSGSINGGKYWNKSIAYTKQSMENNTVNINENTLNTNKYLSFNPRIGINYNLSKDKKITFSYYLSTNKNNTANNSDAAFTELTNYTILSKNESNNRDYLHNFYIEYVTKQINVGADFIFYKNSTDMDLLTQKNNDDSQASNQHSNQKIRQYSLFFNHQIKLNNHFKLSYGTNTGYNHSKTDVNYQNRQSDTIEEEYQPTRGKQIEYHANGYIEAIIKPNSKIYISSSAKIEYFNSIYNNHGIRNMLWNGWSFYPNATVAYSVNNKNKFQFTLSSNKRYPSFWAVNPQITNLSAYTQIEGNPHLKPSKSYQGNFQYVYKRKYIVSLAIQHVSDYFMQIPHMSEDKLKIIHRYENFDNFYRVTAMLAIPFKVGDCLNSRLTLHGYHTNEEIESFYGSSFNNNYFNGIISLNNSVKFSPKLSLQLNGSYYSPSRQGVYRYGSRWGLDSRFEWKTNNQLSFVVHYENILQHQMPRPLKVEYANQYRWSRDYEKSTIGISVLWRFNQYKSERYSSPDDSRLVQ